MQLPENGRVVDCSNNDHIFVGTVCRYICDDGFAMADSQFTTCFQNDTQAYWDKSKLHCEGIVGKKAKKSETR